MTSLPTPRELAESAYAHCVIGDMAACLHGLEALMPLSAVTGQERHAVLRIVDGIAAMLPQRLSAACGAALEADCLRLLSKLCDDGLISGADAYRPLAVGLLHGIRLPLQQDELPERLLTYARTRTELRIQAGKEAMHPDAEQLFGSPLLGSGLALVSAAIAPMELTGQPGNALACMRGIAADAQTETPNHPYRAALLQQALRLGELELFKIDTADVDQRALAHLMFHIFQCRYRLATLRADKNAAVAAINDMHRLAVLAREHSLPEEAWFILAYIARVSLSYPPDSPYPNERLAEAFVQAGECQHLRVAFLEDIISLAAIPTEHYELTAQRCWTAVRQTFASPGTITSPGSRWRAATGLAASLEHLETLSLLDRARWDEPQQWTRALLPLFAAHPFEWRDFAASTTFTAAPVKLVLTCGGSGVWVTNSADPLDPIRLPADFRERLWHNATAAISHENVRENIRDAVVDDVSQLADAGLFPAIRAFNDASRRSGAVRDAAPDFIEALADVAAAKLDSIYDFIRPHPSLAPAGGEYFATAGNLSPIPWEQSFGKDVETACVCLHPASTGVSTVEIANVYLSASSRVGIIADSAYSAPMAIEVATIQACFGTNAEAFSAISLESIQKAAERCQILHVAAHGTSAWRDPRRNVLKFPNAELAAADLAGLDLTGVGLVVVDACDAAAPGVGPHAGEATIVGALLAAGANAVIGALWSIEDECAAMFASALYRAITSGEPLTKAYHSARRALRSHVAAQFGGEHSFLSDAYRLFLRGRGA